jgi:ATP-dependent helicase HepA
MHHPGMKVVHRAQPSWGVGDVVAVKEGGRYLSVRFSGRRGPPILVSSKDPALVRWRFAPGDEVEVDGARARVVDLGEDDGTGLLRYVVELPGGTREPRGEDRLVPRPPRAGALEQLASLRAGDEEAFALRSRAVRLDLERRADALGAMLGSRTMPKPHQLAVVQRVLSARAPRFVLADEVGLGKTIEAGMVYAALAQTGLARRVLVVAPAHLTVQWLAELYHKFHSLFTLVDAERLEAEEEDPRPIWWRHPRIVTSLELLASDEELREQIAAPEAAWDLVIFDEAHHLARPEAYAAAEAAADNSFGLLLLTATPLQLDPEEYFRLLLLVDPASPETFEAFEERLARQGDLSERTRALLAARTPEEAAAAARQVLSLLPDDELLARAAAAIGRPGAEGEEARSRFLSHLAETYSISARLIRNRRALVGGLAPRRLVRHDVNLRAAERAWLADVREAVKGGRVRGSPGRLATILRRVESSPRAGAAVLAAAGAKDLAARASAHEGPGRDAKLRELLSLVREIRDGEPDAKILVFTEAKETLEYLRDALSREGLPSAVYHGELSQLDRDRQVARFRDPEGPPVLVSTEVGGEGRNFQFCHHLVNYDLAWSPAAIEQRIGRLDRIGQVHEVRVHCLRVADTLSAHVFDLMARAVRVFDETVGGLDPVLEIVESDLARLALEERDDAFDRYQKILAERVAAARDEVKRAYDPLLDLRSYDEHAVRALVERAGGRLGIDFAGDEGLEDALWRIARDLDERYEETVTDIARRVGIRVDTDEQVEAFQAAFQLGGEVAVDALPGLELEKGERTLLGSFWRDTAVVQEENDYFGTGHPLVEALFAYLRDGELGRATWAASDLVRPASIGFAFVFLVSFPEPEDLAAGARVPSRQASRYLETQRIAVGIELSGGTGQPRLRDDLLEALEEGDVAPGRPPQLPREAVVEAVNAAHAFARSEAERRLRAAVERAREKLAAERDLAIERLDLAERRVGPDERELLELEKERLREFHDACAGALAGARLELDQAAGLVHEPAE